MKRITIVGAKGYVGKAMVEFFKNHYEVIEVDKDWASAPYKDAALTVVCVPTPMKPDGSCDTSIVEQVIEETNSPLIWIRSTIPPGTTEKLIEKTGKHIVFSPEFIGEGKYWQPYKFNLDEKESPWFIF